HETYNLPYTTLFRSQQQWQKIVIAACEQSGRASVPEVLPALTLEAWLQQPNDALCLTLDPYAEAPLRTLTLPTSKAIRLVIGPEDRKSPRLNSSHVK